FDTIQARLPNRDLDTGAPIRPGGYPLTDTTFAKLLREITKDPSAVIPTELRRQIASYYADPSAPILTRKKPDQWARVQSELTVLAAMKTRNDPPVPDLGPDDDDDTAPVDAQTTQQSP